MKWLERRLPVGALVHSSFVVYPTPRNLNYWWAFGPLLGLFEKTKPLPNSISESVLQHGVSADGSAPPTPRARG
jgi:hypothetical protein